MTTQETITRENFPADAPTFRKRTTVRISFRSKPFTVETQEGPMVISPETVDDWQDGYCVALPDDGSKPYAISPSFVLANYEEVPA